eukprot:gene1762-2428_t
MRLYIKTPNSKRIILEDCDSSTLICDQHTVDEEHFSSLESRAIYAAEYIKSHTPPTVKEQLEDDDDDDDDFESEKLDMIESGDSDLEKLKDSFVEWLVYELYRDKMWEIWFARKAAREYVRFIDLKVALKDFGEGENDSLLVSPSPIVDAVWHTHLLNTRLYMLFCNAFSPRFVHHSTDGAHDTVPRKTRLRNTALAYRARFSKAMPATVWDEDAVAPLYSPPDREEFPIDYIRYAK